MYAVGIQGSPRKNGNTASLLSSFMRAFTDEGVKTDVFHIADLDITPCQEYIVCEKKGYCPLDDQMEHTIFPAFREADIIVFATPVFFYNVPSQLKMLIDRCQTLWARKYRLHLRDPKEKQRSAILLAQGATKGKNLFTGIGLTIAYTCDAIGASLKESRYYYGIEKPGDMKRHPDLTEDSRSLAHTVYEQYRNKKRICFLSDNDAEAGQIASAFTDLMSEGAVMSIHAGEQPATQIHKSIEETMVEEGIDIKYRRPLHINEALEGGPADVIVSLNSSVVPEKLRGTAEVIDWILPAYEPDSKTSLAVLKEAVKEKVVHLLQQSGNMV